jgi:hypothetical protein
MDIMILRRQGANGVEPVARWRDGAWIDRPDDGSFDEYYARGSKERIITDFDGAGLFAVSVGDYRDVVNKRRGGENRITVEDIEGIRLGEPDTTEGRKHLPTSDDVSLQERIIHLLRPRPNEVVSSAWIADRMDTAEGEPDLALQDLIRWGEVELVANTGIAGRVRVKESVEEGHSVWMAYVAPGYEERRATRLFSARSDAVDHLEGMIGERIEDLERVEFLNSVWRGPAGGGYSAVSGTAVLRKEPIHGGGRNRE